MAAQRTKVVIAAIVGAAILPFASYAGLAVFTATSKATHNSLIAALAAAASILAIVGAPALVAWLLVAGVVHAVRWLRS